MPVANPVPDEQPTARESIWTRPDRGARGPLPEHNRAEIASAAIALADSGGLSAASMRAVAGELGTAAGSLYRYLASRDDLLDLMVDAVLAEVPLGGESTGSWLDDLVTVSQAQLALHRRHPWLLEVRLRGGVFGPHATDYFEDCLRIMASLTSGTAAKMEAIAMITGVVSLFVGDAAAAGATAAPANIFATSAPDRHPHLTAALETPDPTPPRQDMFERTIRSVLTGLLE